MAGTINAASLKIGMDIDDVRRNGSFTRSELSQIAQIARQSVTPLETYERKLQLLDRALIEGQISAAKYKQMHATIKEQMERNAAVNVQQSGAIGSLTSSFGRLTAGLTVAAIAYKGFQAAQDGFNLAAKAEQVKAQFEVLTGSAEQTKQLMKDFENLDKNSPINVAAFQEAGKILLGFGVSAAQITPTLDRLSEISMGNEEKFQSLALAFGQVSANGRLMGQEVLQMINAGFNPLQEISRTTGISMAELKKQMEAGNVSAKMLADSLKSATSEGGRFNDMNEKMAETTSVKMSKLANEWMMFKKSLGESVTPGVNNALDGITNTIEGARSFGPWFKEFWANVTGQANKYNREREEANASEKRLADLLKKEQDQLEENNRIAKERADLAAKEAADQEERWKQEEKRIEARKQEFSQTNSKAFEDMKRAQMGEAGFQRDKLLNPGFQMSEGDRIQAAETLDTMAETQRLKAMRQLAEEGEARKKKLEDEAKVYELRQRGLLASDEDRKQWVDTENFLKQQRASESERLAARITELKRQLVDRPDLLQGAVARANTESQQRLQQIYQFGQASFKTISDKSRDGFAAQGRSLQEKFNPAIGFRDEMQRLEMLRNQGNIDARTFNQASMQAASQFQQAMNPNAIASTIAPALRSGSVEAYKFIAQQNEKSKQAAEAKKLAEDQLKELRKIAEQNTNAPRLAMAGRN